MSKIIIDLVIFKKWAIKRYFFGENYKPVVLPILFY